MNSMAPLGVLHARSPDHKQVVSGNICSADVPTRHVITKLYMVPDLQIHEQLCTTRKKSGHTATAARPAHEHNTEFATMTIQISCVGRLFSRSLTA